MKVRMDERALPRSQEVLSTVRTRLQQSPYPTIRDLSFEYDQGVLFLRGRLPSYYHKQLAQTTLARIPGIHEIVNGTEVVALRS
jgi:hypothetical protein